MNTTEQPVITSEAVAAWMRQQLATLHQKHEYGALSVRINGYRDFKREVKFEMYVSKEIQAESEESFDVCLAKITEITPMLQALQLREEAEALIAKAEKLEQAI